MLAVAPVPSRHRAGDPPAQAVDGRARGLQLGQGPRGVVEQDPAGLGGEGPLADPLQQRGAEVFLQQADVVAQRRLAQVQRLGGPRERAGAA